MISGSVRFSRRPISELDTRYIKLDQSTPQTVSGGIPKLDAQISDFNDLDQFVNKRYVDYIVSSLIVDWYATDTDSGTENYKLTTTKIADLGSTQQSISGNNLADGDYIAGWINADGDTPPVLPLGVYDLSIFAEKTGGNKDIQVYWQLVERKSDNSEVVLATSAYSDVIGETSQQYIVPLILDEDHIPASGSRIVGKIYAHVTGTGNAPSLTIYYEDDSMTRWSMPTTTEVLANQYVPYSGANQDVDLGSNSLYVGDNVGIGTASPEYKLHVYQNIANKDLNVFFENAAAGKGAYGNMSSEGAYAAFTWTAKHSGVLQKWLAGQYGSPNFTIRNHTSHTFPLVIDTSDNVGIGTTSPGQKLDVNGDIRLTGSAFTNREDLGAIEFYNEFSTFDHVAAKIYGERGDDDYQHGRLVFQTSNSGSLSDQMVIDEDGKVGIGTASPEYKLDVAGTGHFSDDFELGLTNSADKRLDNVYIAREPNIDSIIALDQQDEFALLTHEPNRSVTITPDPGGDHGVIFEDTSSYLDWASGTSPYPIVIEVDCASNPIPNRASGFYRLALTFRGETSAYPTSAKIEVWDNSASSYTTVFDDDITIKDHVVLLPRFSAPSGSSYNIYKLKLTLYGTNPLPAVLRLQRMILYHGTHTWDPWHLHRLTGGTVFAGVNLATESGNVGIGTTSPGYRLELPNIASTAGRGRANQWVTYSDERAKADTTRLTGALDIINQLNPIQYHAIDVEKKKDEKLGKVSLVFADKPHAKWSYGLCAQELYRVLPDIVGVPEDENTDLWDINYTALIPYNIAAIQELSSKVEKLENEITELKKEVNNG